MIYFDKQNEEGINLLATAELDHSGETVHAAVATSLTGDNDVGIVTLHQEFKDGASQIRVIFDNPEQIGSFIDMLSLLKSQLRFGNIKPVVH